MRLDVYLFEKAYAESRQKAKAMINEGLIFIDSKQILKPSYEVPVDISPADIKLEIKGEVMPYVSRGGLKLKGAMKAFGLDFNGLTVCDIGASTGGFTDCLLQNGAKKVFAVDSGTAQLHEKLKSDKRVVSMENFNAKYLNKEVLGEYCDMAVADLSFISQTKVYPAVCSILKPGGNFVSLIKPQFEAGLGNIGKNGIVKDKKVHVEVIKRIIGEAEKFRLYAEDLSISPIKGGDGNTEYLMLFRYAKDDCKRFDISLVEKTVANI